ncbi:pyridoxamine 5'-phosphate oxidase family protein [Geomonas ferrireducens]|nr:pyridoxamine 5'-phosphate oxidase family protein [Geomonas ferrireducens]
MRSKPMMMHAGTENQGGRHRHPSRRWPIRLRWHRRMIRIGKRRYVNMITQAVKDLAERVGHAFVATSDAGGNPHLAAGRGVALFEPNRLVFEAWFCPTTMRNLQDNRHVAVVVADPDTGNGFQFVGVVERSADTAVLDGYIPDLEPPGLPQVQWRLEIRVEKVMAFSADAHSDRPLG